jgi:phosphopantothenoylcysteine decarboxylase/phosphopantothenate--cysteine ligase
VRIVRVETAREMLAAVEAALPADVAVFCAAVADWRVAAESAQKMKKAGAGMPRLEFTENPDILATISRMETGRPRLVIGFAAETESVVDHATAKRARKGCDWMLANDVSAGTGTMGGPDNTVTLITEAGAEAWPKLTKVEVASRLAQRIAETVA